VSSAKRKTLEVDDDAGRSFTKLILKNTALRHFRKQRVIGLR